MTPTPNPVALIAAAAVKSWSKAERAAFAYYYGLGIFCPLERADNPFRELAKLLPGEEYLQRGFSDDSRLSIMPNHIYILRPVPNTPPAEDVCIMDDAADWYKGQEQAYTTFARLVMYRLITGEMEFPA